MNMRTNETEKQMERCIANYINGNLNDAKRQAKRHSHSVIYNAMRESGCSHKKAKASAHYLKGTGTFQEACDAD